MIHAGAKQDPPLGQFALRLADVEVPQADQALIRGAFASIGAFFIVAAVFEVVIDVWGAWFSISSRRPLMTVLDWYLLAYMLVGVSFVVFHRILTATTLRLLGKWSGVDFGDNRPRKLIQLRILYVLIGFGMGATSAYTLIRGSL
jgi:hypothetical protein